MTDDKWIDYRQPIVGFIEEVLLYGETFPISDEASIRDEGVVDSLGILNVITFIASQFQISVDDEDLVPENFDSIKSICEFVRRKLAA